MRRQLRHFFSIIIFHLLAASHLMSSESAIPSKDSCIFIYGGDIQKAYIKYVAALTKKERPKIGLLPTGTADNPQYINHFYYLCSDLSVEPHIIYTWVSSQYCKQSFEEMMLDLDAIIVGGGNTLNMIAIWHAQGIDSILRKAAEKGIVLAGGSAGSICWFNAGISDSRPKSLSIVEGLGFLKFSHCPHYSNESERKLLYLNSIKTKTLQPGYACDDYSGILFKNGEMVKAVTLRREDRAYFVTLQDNDVVTNTLPVELIK